MADPRSAPLLAVSVCLSDGQRILVVERGRGAFAGKLSLPGGKVRFGETLLTAARRELAEETRLSVGDLAFLTLHEAIDDAFHAVIAVYAGVLDSDDAPQAGDDAASVHLLTIDEIRRAELRKQTTDGLAAVAERALEALSHGTKAGP
ncbi:NUDIX domain-containing protein [Aurantimonas sp. VKM B-3413]|uniref:NUDIX domain-containing protein n=1 Tax=Aurantimonas sp. VKM B-3413 TaxID=2779401 RepID=UPI001E469CEB|nr:NUDIX domain-containing protein [Aurantimonas sp. VKM B-3413]MCB8836030.1 NUDIX domain-containing protein [Aurantimonas sp. VKM B-3413]